MFLKYLQQLADDYSTVSTLQLDVHLALQTVTHVNTDKAPLFP